MRTTHVAALAYSFLTLTLPRPGWSQQIDSQKDSAVAQAQVWLDAGLRAQKGQDLQHAIENLEKALAAFRALHDRPSEATTLNRLGFTHVSLNAYVEAIGFYEQALEIERDLQDLRSEGATLNNLGAANYFLGKYAKAIDLYGQALVVERKAADRAGEGDSFHGVGLAYASLSEYTKAITFFERALAIRRETGDRIGEGATLNSLGMANRSLGQYAKAISFYHQALEAEREAHDRAGEGNTLNNLGLVCASLSRYAEAIDFYHQALEIRRDVHDRVGEATTLHNLGFAYRSLNQNAKAIGLYEQALAIRQEVQDRPGQGTTLNNLGATYASLGQHAKAIGFFERALAIRQEIHDRAGEGTTLNNLGGVYASLGQYANAIGLFERAVVIRVEVHDRAGEGVTLNNLGGAYDALSEHAKAIGFHQRALAIAREVGDRAAEAAALKSLMYSLASQDRVPPAILFGKQMVNVYQKIRQDLMGLDKDVQKTFLTANEDDYRELANLLLEQDRIVEAQQVLNLLKEEEFFDFVRRDAGQASSLSGPADLTRTEADWDRRYNEIANRLTELGHERGELIALPARTDTQEQRLASLDRELTIAGEAFQKFLARLEAEASQQKLAKEKIDQVKDSEALMETLRELGANTVAVYTLVTEDKLRLILITPDVVKTAEAAITRTDLNASIVAFRDSLENPRGDPRPLASELYRLIVGPIERDLAEARAETILWSLDGALRYLPVAALHDGEHYLVECFRNVVFTPASNANLKDVPAVQWRALGLGVSKKHEGFGALPGAQKELEAIIHDEATGTHGVLPGAIQLDDAFTRESMVSALRQRYRVVHIASHFRFKPGNETDSYLLIGDGGHMSLADVGTMENPFGGVDLLTLSACDTASGGTGENGKEVEGFAVLAQRKGAKAVIATLWPVADASTNELMQSFYRIRESKQGMPKVEALQQAQLALLRGSTYSHPYYWAPFILIGNSR